MNNQKAELLALIRRAKSSHIQWRAFAQGLVGGVKFEESRAPVKHTECKFGKWYYGEGRKQLGDLEIYGDIEGPHEMLHAIYEQVHTLVQKKQVEAARQKLGELVGVSQTLLELLDLLEKEAKDIPE